MALNSMGLGFLFTAKDLASGTMNRLDKNFHNLSEVSEETATKVAQNFSHMATGIGLMGAGLAGLSILKSATQDAQEFSYQIARIRTVIDEASLSTDKARESTMKLAETYGSDAVKQADALYETISAGVTDATEAIDLLAIANKFAVGGTAELSQGIDVLISAVNTYRDKGLSAAEASDIMFTAIAAGKTTAAELANKLGEVAPTAHAMGVKFDELNAAIAAMTVQGVKTPQAVTGLNAMLSNIASPTKQAAAEAKRLGIQFNATALKTMGLSGFLAQLAGNAKVNDNTFSRLFGSIDGIKAAFVLTAQDGAKMNDILGQMQNTAGATDKAFDIMSKTTKFQGQRFDALYKNTRILIGEALEPLLANLIGIANTVLQKFNAIPKPFRDFAVKALAAASAITAITGAVVALNAAFKIMKITGIGSLTPIISAIGSLLVPVALIGAAVYALKIAWDKNFGDIQGRVMRIWEVISLFAEGIYQLFTQGGFSGAVQEALSAPANAGLKEFLIDIYQTGYRVYTFFMGVWEGFTSIVARSEPVFTELWEAISRVYQLVADMISLLFGFGDAIPSAETRAWGDYLGSTIADILVYIVDVIATLIDWFAAFVEGVLAGVNSMAPWFEYLWGAIVQVWDAIVGVWEAIFGVTDASTDWGEIFSYLGEVVGWLAGLLAGPLGFALEIVADILGVIATVITAVVDAIKWVADQISWVVDQIFGASEEAGKAVDKVGELDGQTGGDGAKPKDMSKEIDAMLKNKPEGGTAMAAFKGQFEPSVRPSAPGTGTGTKVVPKRPTPFASTDELPAASSDKMTVMGGLPTAKGASKVGMSTTDLTKALKEAMIQANKDQPVTATVTLVVDGATLAKVTAKAKQNDDARQYKNMIIPD